MQQERKLLFSVGASDCEWSYTKGRGAGGQKKNKTSSAVHCTHRPSGAHGYAEDTRSQHQNKALAFERMANTKAFQDWHKLEIARRTGAAKQLDDYVEEQLNKVRMEVKVDGRWVIVDKDALLEDDNE